MNKNLFCILFNAAKGGWIVVRESALSRGTLRYCGCVPMLLARVTAGTGVLAVLLNPVLQAAGIAADASAPAQNRPQVEITGQGTPLVQIAAPNAAGLSNNHYHRFNVDRQGVILNNAASAAMTQLGGAVAANPNLGSTGAAIILNQVTGVDPSTLAGYLEVAGRRADVIVANPNGIICNGGGFINAGRGVLTTGEPIIVNGGLEGFRVTGGKIEIGRRGLDLRQVDQADLIARSLEINGKVRSRGTLNVITGRNQVDYANLGLQVLEDAAGKPAVSLDVGSLGGMYARKIHLVGTEKGVGVNSHGTLAAGSCGFTCTQEGRIRLTNQTASLGDLALQSKDRIEHSGTLDARGDLSVTGAHLALAKATTEAGGDATLTATAGGIEHQGGQLRAGGRFTAVASGALVNDDQGRIEARLVRVKAGSMDNRRGEVRSEQLQVQATTLTNAGGKLIHQGSGPMTLEVAGTLDNCRGGLIESGSTDLELGPGRLDNSGGTLTHLGTGTLSLGQGGRTEALINQGGAITSQGKLDASAGGIDNRGGTLAARHDVHLAAAQEGVHNDAMGGRRGFVSGDRVHIEARHGVLGNAGGLIEGVRGVTLEIQSLRNAGGAVTSLKAAPLHVAATGTIGNEGGIIGGNGRVRVTAKGLENEQGILSSGADLELVSDRVTGAGVIAAGRDAKLDLKQDCTHPAGNRLTARRDLSLTTTGSYTNAGNLFARGTLTVTAAAVHNRESAVILGKTSRITATRSLVNQGRIGGESVALQADGARIENQGGRVEALKSLSVTAAELGNAGGVLLLRGLPGWPAPQGPGSGAREGLQVTVRKLDNTGGQVRNLSGQALTVAAPGEFLNGQGELYSLGPATVAAGRVVNTQGALLGSTTLNLESSGDLANAKGRIGSCLDLALTAGAVEGDGQIEGGADTTLTLTGDGKGSSANRIAAGRHLALTATQAWKNAGSLRARGSVTLRAGEFQNLASGEIHSPIVEVTGTRKLANEGKGRILGETVTLRSDQDIVNRGTVAAGGKATLTSKGAIHNTGGTVSAQRDLELAALEIDSTGVLGAGIDADGKTGRCRGHLKATARGKFRAIGQNLAGGDLSFTGPGLTLSGATTQALGDITLTANGGALEHQGGQLKAGGQFRVLNAASLVNRAGTITAAGRGDGTLQFTGKIDNHAGTIVSNAANLTLQSGSLENGQNGRIHHAGTGLLKLVQGELRNAGGALASNGAVSIHVASLNNEAGSITARKALTVARSQDLRNARGVMETSGRLVLAAGKVINDGGRMVALGGPVLIQRAAELSNAAGTTFQGACGGWISGSTGTSIHAGRISNAGGTIHAGTGDSVVTGTASILNSNAAGTRDRGVIGGLGSVTICTPALQNIQGGLLFAGRGLTLDTTQFTNTGGKAHAQAGLRLDKAGATVSNGRGSISAAGDVRLNLAGLANKDGVIVAGQDLGFTAPTLPSDGILAAGRDARYTLQGDYTLAGGKTLSANRDLTLTTTGSLTLGGSLDAARCLKVRAANITSQASGLMVGETAQVTASAKLVNFGRIYGDDIALGAWNFINGRVAPPAHPNQPALPGTVAAHRSLHIGAQTVSSHGKDSLLSSGNVLAIGGRLDDKHQAIDRARQIDNYGARLQAVDGDMHLNAILVNNSNHGFATVEAVVSRENLRMYKATDNPVGPLGKRYLESQLLPAHWAPHGATGAWYSAEGDFPKNNVKIWAPGQLDIDADGRGHFTHYTKWEVTRTVTRTQVSRTAPGQILAGGSLHLNADRLVNDKSRIIAGKDMQVPRETLRNVDARGRSMTEDKGCVYESAGIPGGRYDNPRTRKPYLQRSSVPFTLSVSECLAHTRPSVSPTPARASSGARATRAVPSLRLPDSDGLPAGKTGQPQTVGDAVAPIPGLRVPEGGLYRCDTSATAPCLVVTDPAFLRGRTVKGLEHMLERLPLAPGTTSKRMGDGYYETQLVIQQILDLTARPRVLANSNSANGEFVALMDNGMSVSGGLQLKPGQSPTDHQLAALPKPCVWPVQQQVTTPTGQDIPVLVPVFFLAREQAKRLAPLGTAVISADTMSGRVDGEVKNSGTLLAARTMAITAGSFENKGSVRTTEPGSVLSLHADKELVHQGHIQGGQVNLKAGGSLTMCTDTSRIEGNTSSGSIINQVATVVAESLSASAGRDLKLTAAQVHTTGSTSLAAARDVVLDTVATGYRDGKVGGRQYSHTRETALPGTQMHTGSLALEAGRHIHATAAELKIEQEFKAKAGGDMTLAAAKESRGVDVASHTSRSAFAHSSDGTQVAGCHVDAGSVHIETGGRFTASAADLKAKGAFQARSRGSMTLGTATETRRVDEEHHNSGGSWLSSWSETSRSHRDTSRAVGSLVSADTVDLQTDQRMRVEGSTVVGTGDVRLVAQKRMELKAATQASHTSTYSHREDSGLLTGGGGLGITIGRRGETHQGDQRRTIQSQARSQVGSLGGNVTVTSSAGEVGIHGSDLTAGGSIEVQGQRLRIDPGLDETLLHERHEVTQSGLTLNVGCAAVSLAQGAAAHLQAAADPKGDGRALALNALASAVLVKNLAARAQQLQAVPGGNLAAAAGLQISAAIGSSHSESESHARSRVHAGSTY